MSSVVERFCRAERFVATDFTLPELGENIAAGDVLRVLVNPGDTLAKDQPVLELETDKATIEVPSSVEGTVGDIKVKQGEKVKVGQVILTVAGGTQTAPAKAEGQKAGRPESKAEEQAAPERKADRQQGQEGTERADAAADRPGPRADVPAR